MSSRQAQSGGVFVIAFTVWLLQSTSNESLTFYTGATGSPQTVALPADAPAREAVANLNGKVVPAGVSAIQAGDQVTFAVAESGWPQCAIS